MKNEIHCPLCGQRSVSNFLSRVQIPVHQNLVMETKEQAKGIQRGDLELKYCNHCAFIFNAAFDPHLLSYGPQYDNTQDCSSAFQEHVQSLISDLVEKKGITHHRIVEIGCGKGSFLKALVAHPASHNTGIGFDPSYEGEKTVFEGRIRFENCFYDEKCSDVPVDVVICRHVIEHIQSPVEFLKTVRKALMKFPQARLFFETPCSEWILRNEVIWDFFYEHCSYFTANNLAFAFTQAGFHVDAVRHVFGGQYLWLEASCKKPNSMVSLPSLSGIIQNYIFREQKHHSQWTQKIRELRKDGPIAIWGAGAKGVTFVNLIDPNRTLIDCVVDLNPNKQNKFIPGTGHPVVNFRELSKRGVLKAIMMNPNYLFENSNLLKENNISVELL